jgi:serine/threonine protein kinase/tetratricopeptide (TPR) repeat protein
MSEPSPNGRPIFEGESERLEQIVGEYESAWRSGLKPDLDSYLSAGDVEPRSLLVELVHADLECRLKAGEPVRVESYFGKYAELAADHRAALGLIAAEYNLRRRREPGLLLEEYLNRFPQFRADLPQRIRGPHTLLPESPPPADAKSVGKFELLDEVGQGAFGTVYRARDKELDRIVAVKLPRADRSLTAADAEKFQREARNAAQLSHPSIVPVYEVGKDAAVPYIVSAYIEGVTLADALVRRHLDYKQIAAVMAQVADGLDHAHRHGVIHRDLKPSNIMLGKIQGVGSRESGVSADNSPLPTPDSRFAAPQAFVMDFGLARREDGDIRMTVEGLVLGTPAYMSSEQARGENSRVTERSDVYGMGVILYELLTGEVPFRGAARMILHQIIHDEPRPPRRLDDKIPRDLETIALKCMAKEPGRRYATAGDLAADLRRYLDGVPIVARPVGRLERGWRWAKRKPLVAGLTATSIFLLLTVAVVATVASFRINAKKIEAERSDALARQSLDLTLDTLHNLVNDIQDRLDDQPALYALRKELIQKALVGMRQVAEIARDADVDSGLRSAHERLGDIFLQIGHAPEAREQYEQFLAIVEHQVEASTHSGLGRTAISVASAKLGEACLQMGDVPAAESYCRRAVETAESVLKDDPESPNALRATAQSCFRFGKVAMQRGNPQAASESFQRAVEMSWRYPDSAPDSLQVKQELADALKNLGEAQLQLGLRDQASSAYQEYMKYQLEIAQARPESARARRSLAIGYLLLGDNAKLSNNIPAAKEAYRHALVQREQLAAQAPKNSLAQAELSKAYGKLGELLEGENDLLGARELYEKALPPLEGFAAAYPNNARLKRDSAVAYLKLAIINRKLQDSEQAQTYREKAFNEFEDAIEKSPENVMAVADLAGSHSMFGHLEMSLQNYIGAVVHFERGSALLRDLEAAGKLHAQPPLEKLLRNLTQKLDQCYQRIEWSLWPRVVYEALAADSAR